jgi:hypothetical protein
MVDRAHELLERYEATKRDRRADPATSRKALAVTIELLYFDGCPGHERILPRLSELAQLRGAKLVLRSVDTPEDAERERFLGSPTVRVDGRDVDPGAGLRTDYGLKCRLYHAGDQGRSTVPPESWIRAALDAAHA